MNRFHFRVKPVGLCLLVLLFLASVVGADSIWAESNPLMGIRKKAEHIKSLHAEFIQQKQLKILVRPLISKGHFVFKAPSSIRWEYTSPVRSVIVLHRGQVSRFFTKDGLMVKDVAADLQVMQIVMQNITRWLSGRFDENPGFSVTVKENRILLKPSEQISGIIKRIELLLSKGSGMIASITIFEDRDNYTKIEFKMLEINGPIPDSVFEEI